jgi:hypothetical protein
LGKLAEESTITHLMPYVVHDVQLLAGPLHLIDEHKEVDEKTMHFIMIGVLGVAGASVDTVHDVIDGEKVVGTSTQCPSGDVEVDHLLFGHGLGLEMNPEEVVIIIGEIIPNAPSKFLPSGFHHVLFGHPLKLAEATFILKKYHCGVELAYHFLGEVVSEGHQRNQPLLFAHLECVSKVFTLGLKLLHVDGVLGATLELLCGIDIIVDSLLINVMEEVIGTLASISWQQVWIGPSYPQELVLFERSHRLWRTLGSLFGRGCLPLALGGSCRHNFFLLFFFSGTTRRRLDLGTTTGLG